MSRFHKRIAMELHALAKESQAQGVAVQPNVCITEPWRAWIKGPPESVYEDLVYEVSVNFPSNYPFKPPRIMFVSSMWHPNIGVNGHVCLDILQREWSPALTLFKVLQSIQSLLTDADCSSPLNAEAAREWSTATRHDSWDAYRGSVHSTHSKGQVPNIRFFDDVSALFSS